MDDKDHGLYSKYKVIRADGSGEPGGKHENCSYFILDLDHDPFALPALEAYAGACAKDGYTKLSDDLLQEIKARRDL